MDSIGDTFVVANPKNGIEHFYVVIGLADTGDPIAVNATSTRIERSTCFLEPGDHPWIVKKSGINFWDVERPLSLDALKEGVRKGLVRPHVPLSLAVVARIIEAARQSRHFPEHLRDCLAEP